MFFAFWTDRKFCFLFLTDRILLVLFLTDRIFLVFFDWHELFFGLRRCFFCLDWQEVRHSKDTMMTYSPSKGASSSGCCRGKSPSCCVTIYPNKSPSCCVTIQTMLRHILFSVPIMLCHCPQNVGVFFVCFDWQEVRTQSWDTMTIYSPSKGRSSRDRCWGEKHFMVHHHPKNVVTDCFSLYKQCYASIQMLFWVCFWLTGS